MRRGLFIVMAAALALGGCGPDHKLQHLPSPDGRFVATVDYETKLFGVSNDAVISLQEKGGLATEVAKFKNVRGLQVAWISPEDFAVCQTGAVQLARPSVTLNASTGPAEFHIHYTCPPQ